MMNSILTRCRNLRLLDASLVAAFAWIVVAVFLLVAVYPNVVWAADGGSKARPMKNVKKAAKLKKFPNALIDVDEWLGTNCAERKLAYMRNRKAAVTAHDACVKAMKNNSTLENNEAVDLAVEAYCPHRVTSDDLFSCERNIEQETLLACETGQMDKCLVGAAKDKKARIEIAKFAQCRKKVVVEAQRKRLNYNAVYYHLSDRCQWPKAMEAEFFGDGDVDYESSPPIGGLGCIDTGSGRGCGGRLSGMARALTVSGKDLEIGRGGCDELVGTAAGLKRQETCLRELRRQQKQKGKGKGKGAKALKSPLVNPWLVPDY